MKRFFLLAIALSAPYLLHARQDIDKILKQSTSSSPREVTNLFPINSLLPIRFGGYINYEAYWDTRQVVGTDEDEFLLFPEPELLDANCDDINAKGQFTSVAIQSRMRLEIDGPKIKHARSKGVIEYDFIGQQEITNILRMRHAYIELTWDKASLIAGQTWHPLYVPGVDPRTISFNTGSPIEVFARSPQIRLTYTPNVNLSLLFAASSELESLTDGPIGFSSSYLRNAVIPRLDFRLDTYLSEHRIGADIDFKRIQPRLKTDTGLKTREKLSSVIATIYGSFQWDSMNTRTKFIFYQNATDMTMLGGYAVDSVNPTPDDQTYRNLNGISFWNDTEITKSKTVIPGWFIGFAKNLGARGPICQNVVDADGKVTDKRIFGIGTDLNYLFRFSPRVLWKVKNFALGIELEYTRAGYGTIDCNGDVVCLDPVGNTRIMASLFYYL